MGRWGGGGRRAADGLAIVLSDLPAELLHHVLQGAAWYRARPDGALVLPRCAMVAKCFLAALQIGPMASHAHSTATALTL